MVLSAAARSLLLLLALAHTAARPLVRNIKTDAEFKKLLKHHAEVGYATHVALDFWGVGATTRGRGRPPAAAPAGATGVEAGGAGQWCP